MHASALFGTISMPASRAMLVHMPSQPPDHALQTMRQGGNHPFFNTSGETVANWALLNFGPQSMPKVGGVRDGSGWKSPESTLRHQKVPGARGKVLLTSDLVTRSETSFRVSAA